MEELEKVVGIAIPALQVVVEMLREGIAKAEMLPFVDRSVDMPINWRPDHPYLVQRKWLFWPTRESAVTGITIHHTMSHSPLATAQYCTRPQAQGGKGYPSVQYHFWVSQGDGCPIYLLAPVEWQLWHDCTGAYQTTISVGMAGSLHLQRPPDEQLEATARLVAWLMRKYDVRAVAVRGHKERYAGTVCPGWDDTGIARPSGLWRPAFYEALNDAARG